MSAPLIVDTDAGGDPDDAVALVLAASRPELTLVITGDECGGERARFTRHLLDLLGRADVPVVRGTDLGNTRYVCIDGLVPDTVPAQPDGMLDAVLSVCDATDGPVRWVGIGPLSNLAAVLTAHPPLAERLTVTQMGGALNYRDPERAEHNFRLDPAAAATVLAHARDLTLVMSDVTFTPELEIAPGSTTHRALAGESAPAWARLVAGHMARWFDRFHPGTIQHDALTLATALGRPFVELATGHVALDELARMRSDENGTRVALSRSADYPAAMAWIGGGLGAALAREEVTA
ncbi:pyrimidine-specific ribonucleoside hydrolase [Herbihabitans rhizosphaerae]|uniref:Pyrimidine-specific ribonucleoside hydrolase n=1 Tax=Herbihabitans rhizosphaerae TaxID=1872711 RepID=A0A4Q7KVP6_9PSEU|nr:nucleoside hydrolase [Herbihabitans rhizosphaerae]RZS40717.1 pyrimidine-specific ribonucleoside hydrolase [Herbihabitans rhizosphaerae]